MEGKKSASPLRLTAKREGRDGDAKIETIHCDNGDVYEGELNNSKRHGRGVYKHANGDVFDGEWKDDEAHGSGTWTSAAGDVYEGEYRGDKKHGTGTFTWTSGTVYYGEFAEGQPHGWGKQTFASGGLEEVYEGQWVRGKQHGKGTAKLASGVFEGDWVDGQLRGNEKEEGIGAEARARNEGTAPGASREKQPEKETRIYDERTLRSAGSQQRRLERNMTAKKSRGSHQRICDIVSELPPRDADELDLKYDREKMVDLDAGLRYGTKYMSNLKHLTIDLKEMASGDTIRLSTKQLSSLLKSKKGALESVFSAKLYLPGISINGYDVWRELHGLKQLRLDSLRFDEVQVLRNIIEQQSNTLTMLALPNLHIDWRRAKCRRAFAQAVGSCKHLVRLELAGCVLMDADLKIMLQDLPNLRVIHLTRANRHNHEFTDNTCGLIARKCPNLQELDLENHDHLSARGIRKIFEGCSHLRAFATTTCKLSCENIRDLLGTAPQLLCLSLNKKLGVSDEELNEIIEATGGRTLVGFGVDAVYEPKEEGVSAKTREKYQHQEKIVCNVWSKSRDPNVANEWEELL